MIIVVVVVVVVVVVHKQAIDNHVILQTPVDGRTIVVCLFLGKGLAIVCSLSRWAGEGCGSGEASLSELLGSRAWLDSK